MKNLHKNNNNIFFKKNNELQIKKYNFTVKLNNNSKNILIEKYNIDTIDLYNQKINNIFILFIKKINNYNSSYKKVIDKLLDLNFNINIIDYNKIIHNNKFNYYNLIIFNKDNINNYITNKKHTKLLFDNIKYFFDLFTNFKKNGNLNNLIFLNKNINIFDQYYKNLSNKYSSILNDIKKFEIDRIQRSINLINNNRLKQNIENYNNEKKNKIINNYNKLIKKNKNNQKNINKKNISSIFI